MKGHDLGRRGEGLVARYLEAQGWTVLERNYRAGPLEIDLIVARDRTVAFVEVKTRSTTTGGSPLDPVGWRKRQGVAEAARRWIYEKGRPETIYRFDAIGVSIFGSRTEIEHIADAWRL